MAASPRIGALFTAPYTTRPKHTPKRRQNLTQNPPPATDATYSAPTSRSGTPTSSRSAVSNTSTAAPPSERVRVGVDRKSALWEYYNREASEYDNELFLGYRETLNSNLLVVMPSLELTYLRCSRFISQTTLFLGLVAAFLINALNVNPAEIYANALNQAVLLSINISSNNALPTDWQPITAAQLSPSPDSTGVISVTLWGSCMVICLGTMLFATSAKSWLVEYSRDMKNGNPYMCAQKRQLRFDELLKWKVETIISALPWFFQLSLFMFVIGLSVTLMQFHSIPGKVVISLSCIVLGVYIITTVLPLFIPSCPYNTPAVVLFHKMFRLVLQSVRDGWLYLLKKISIVLAYCNLTSGSWTLWSKELFKSGPVHRADSHEQQLLEKSKSVLSWKAVTWLLTSSQNTATTDMALRSLWNLKYIPKQISIFLPTKAPMLLYSKLSVELAQPEEFFEQVEPEAPPEMHAFLSSPRITDFMASFLHLWKCVSLDEIDSPQALACITGQVSYSRLHPELMDVWDDLKVHCSSYTELDSYGWPYHNFVVVIAIELVYYYLHPDHFLQEKAEVGSGHPLADVKMLLDWHISDIREDNGTMHLKHHTLRLLLDALAHTLWKTDFAVLKEHRKDVLALLIQLLGTLNAKDIRIFMPLAACFSMFSHLDPQVKKSVLVARMNTRAQNLYKADSNPDYEHLLKAVGHVFRLYQQGEEFSDENWTLIQTLFNFAHATNTTELFIEDLFLELPCVYIEQLITNVAKDSAFYGNVPWLTLFMLKTHARNVVGPDSTKVIFKYLRIVLCMSWSDYKEQLSIVSVILESLKVELARESSYRSDICLLLIEAMGESLGDRNRTVLRRCVASELLKQFTDLKTGTEVSHLQMLLRRWRADNKYLYLKNELDVRSSLCTMYNVS
ncbi:hypothetical protein CPB85DRAFT_881790 [Mucidula mucida]|nr:hypothetical protein CPB85DRAFT_881790 [Mucidula mucida]